MKLREISPREAKGADVPIVDRPACVQDNIRQPGTGLTVNVDCRRQRATRRTACRKPPVAWANSDRRAHPARLRHPTDTSGAHATRIPRARSRADAGDGHARRARPPAIPVLPASRASESRERDHATATRPARHTRSMIACGGLFARRFCRMRLTRFRKNSFGARREKRRTPISDSIIPVKKGPVKHERAL